MRCPKTLQDLRVLGCCRSAIKTTPAPGPLVRQLARPSSIWKSFGISVRVTLPVISPSRRRRRSRPRPWSKPSPFQRVEGTAPSGAHAHRGALAGPVRARTRRNHGGFHTLVRSPRIRVDIGTFAGQTGETSSIDFGGLT